MLKHRQNSYAPRSKRHTDRREAQSHGTGQLIKNPPYIFIAVTDGPLVGPKIFSLKFKTFYSEANIDFFVT
jgi:hypothetical protein